MRRIFLLICLLMFCLAAAGCTKSTGVMPWGPKDYSLTVDMERCMLTSPSDAERKAYDEAVAFCGSLNQDVLVKEFCHSRSWTHYTVKFIFRCVDDKAAPDAPYQKIDVEML